MFSGLTYKYAYIQTVNFVKYEIGYPLVVVVVLFVLIEWFGRTGQHAIARIDFTWNRPLRYTFYYVVIIAILWLGGKEQEFIYFQF